MFNLPNALTVSNLFFGCCAIISLNQACVTQTVLFVLAAAFVDFFDGFVARKLKMESNLGVQLDSLSDVVSFGVVPGLMAYTILRQIQSDPVMFAYAGFILAVCAAFRLARFNVQSSGKDLFFTGLPVPANALFFCGMYYLNHLQNPELQFLFDPVFFLVVVFLFSYLMVSQWKILKLHPNAEWIKKYGWILLLDSVSLLSSYWIGFASLSVLIIVHIGSSILQYYLFNKNKTIHENLQSKN